MTFGAKTLKEYFERGHSLHVICRLSGHQAKRCYSWVSGAALFRAKNMVTLTPWSGAD